MTHPEKRAANKRAASVDDRRSSNRRTSDIALRIAVDTNSISGRAENVSQAGVFFFSGDKLRVTVHMEQDGATRAYSGHIVRVERLSEDSTGFAIEFDRA